MQKFIFSVKSSSSLGREYGIVKVNVHVETLGSTAESLKEILGWEPGKPNGGTSEHPVRKINTSFILGIPSG